MTFQNFELKPHNSHYEGAYDDRELRWRRVCAIDKVQNLRTLMRGTPVDSVLEVGCGTGAVLAEVARRSVGKQHTGIDMADPHMHMDSGAAALQMLPYDGAAIPFPPDSFDLVYASHVVEHVPDPRGLLAEIFRVSKKLIYVEVPCELHIRTSHRALQSTVDIGHINAYTPESFVILLQTAGLKVAETRLFDHSQAVHSFNTSRFRGAVKGLIRGALLSISPVLASRTFTYHCGALCTKE